MKFNNPTGDGQSASLKAVLILAFLLGILFWRSFLPEYVHFSNDGPLGQQNTASAHLPDAFRGTWNDNNDIGSGAGAWPFSVASLFRWAVGPIGYAKFLAPFALFILGLGAFCFFRALKMSPLAVTLGALAAMLNSTFLSTACWGVAPQEIGIGMDFFALALVVSAAGETSLVNGLARLALAGLCVGMNVIEAADIGAIFSLFVSAFIVLHALNQGTGPAPFRLARGIGQTVIVAGFAGFIAYQSVVSLIGTQIQGVAGTAQDSASKLQHWDWATQWSLPKSETFELFVPGLFGYKLDTPNKMDPNYMEHYVGGNYWGGMGRDPNWDRYYAAGSQGNPPQGMLRQTGGENYAGILVVLLGVWAAAQALRKSDSIYSAAQRRAIWFWSAVAVVSILFAWGRFSIFYGLLYQLPYFSTIRSPTKFLIVFSWAIVVLFAYGVEGLSRRYLAATGGKYLPPLVQFNKWWTTAAAFDRRWTFGVLGAVGASVLGWLIYAGEKPALIAYLQSHGFPGASPGMAEVIATFSIGQAGIFVLLFAVAAGLCLLVISGVLGGPRAKWGGLLLGAFLLADLGRASLPYIIHWDYQQKYDIDPSHPGQSANPILNFLKDKSYEHRVAQLPFGTPEGMENWEQLYTIEWMQHQFPYYNIQSLDNWQRPRVGSDIATYENAVYSRGVDGLTRQWELTNTRYLLGAAGFLEGLNTRIDPQHRFRIAQRFNVLPKPGITRPTKLEEITAVPDENGAVALFEFTGALPRAKLYANWQVNTNDQAVLDTLVSPAFEPAQTVLVSTPQTVLAAAATNANTGTVEYQSYAPTKIVLAATNSTAAVLLLNDKFDPGWSARVDGQPVPVLRCNFIMRGIYLTPGQHTVEFRYVLPSKPMYITLAGFVAAILLSGFLLVAGSRKAVPAAPVEAGVKV